MKPMSSHHGWLMLILFLWTGSGASAQVVYDVAGDFSLASNPNSVWSYGTTGTSLTGTFTLFSTINTAIGTIPTFHGWGGTQPAFGANYPLAGKNFSATNGAAFDVVLLPNQFALHPAPNGAFAVARLTAPASGFYQLNAVFEGREFLGSGPATNADVHILVNGTAIFSGLVAGFGPPSDQSLTTMLNLNPGDRVDFSVGLGTDATFLGDTVSLNATFSAVPEPGSLLLVASAGLAACVWMRRRRPARVA